MPPTRSSHPPRRMRLPDTRSGETFGVVCFMSRAKSDTLRGNSQETRSKAFVSAEHGTMLSHLNSAARRAATSPWGSASRGMARSSRRSTRAHPAPTPQRRPACVRRRPGDAHAARIPPADTHVHSHKHTCTQPRDAPPTPVGLVQPPREN